MTGNTMVRGTRRGLAPLFILIAMLVAGCGNTFTVTAGDNGTDHTIGVGDTLKVDLGVTSATATSSDSHILVAVAPSKSGSQPFLAIASGDVVVSGVTPSQVYWSVKVTVTPNSPLAP